MAGTAVGGTIVAFSGVAGSFIVGSAKTSIEIFGMTGVQTYALGSIFRNLAFYILASYLDIGE